jgi:hypothetical protein
MRPSARRRVVPLLAVALGAGCMLQSDAGTGSAAIYWTFWSRSLGEIGAVDGSAAASCSAAGVQDVKLTLTDPAGDVREPATRPCVGPGDVPGAAFVELEPGTWGYVLEARRGGRVVYEAIGSFEVVADTRRNVDVEGRPPAGHWDVVVAVTTTSCAAGDRLDFDLFDVGGTARVTVYSTRDASVNPLVSVPCDVGSPVTIPSVAPGSYELSDWAHVDAAGGTVKHWSTCRPAWTQGSVADTPLAVSVTAAADAQPPAGNAGVCP